MQNSSQVSAPNQVRTNKFKYGCCACCDNGSACGTCCWACFCPCWVQGKNHEDMTGQSCWLYCILSYVLLQVGVPGAMGCLARNEVKGVYDIKQDFCEDFWIYCCCLPCAQTQERRQIKEFPTNQGTFQGQPVQQAPQQQQFQQGQYNQSGDYQKPQTQANVDQEYNQKPQPQSNVGGGQQLGGQQQGGQQYGGQQFGDQQSELQNPNVQKV